MTIVQPTVTIPVDLTNPGQFFGCCGLLELAGRHNPHAEAWFEDGRFNIRADVSAVLSSFFECTVEVEKPSLAADSDAADAEDDDISIDEDRGRINPMRLLAPFNLRLDWWNDDEAQGQKLKTWTAGQRVTDILIGHHKAIKRNGKAQHLYIRSMREHFAAAVVRDPRDWLRAAIPIEAPMAFSYDSRLCRNNALDLGHTNAGILAFSPAIDVLTLIGLQRFRPRMMTPWSRNQFCTWFEPLPAELAAIATLGMIPELIGRCYDFPIIRRDSQGRFKLFGHAQPAKETA